MIRSYLPAIALALAACAPGAAEYTKAEAPNQLQVEGSTGTFEVSFAPNSNQLSAAQGVRLDQLVASGAIGSADRVMVAASGSPGLAAAREAAVASHLLRWGIVAGGQPLPVCHRTALWCLSAATRSPCRRAPIGASRARTISPMRCRAILVARPQPIWG